MTRRSRNERSSTIPRRTRRTDEPSSPAERLDARTLVPSRAHPLVRDPWAWIAALSVLPLVLHSWGAPLGEPFADDFDYLRRAMLEPSRSWLDAGGFTLYWRPLGRQAYFGALASAILDQPWVVPLIHTVALAFAALLLQRALAPRLGGAGAAAAASFVPLMESSRMLTAWASHWMDVGALLFAALALHAASRERFVVAVPAAIGSLLCKETGSLALLLLPWMPASAQWTPGRRLRWSLAMLAAVGVWGMAYAAVAHREGFTFAATGGTERAGFIARIAWAMARGARAGFSLPEAGFAGTAFGVIVLGSLAVAVLWCGVRTATDRAARVRLAGALPWSAWGIAWFVLAAIPLAQVHPEWAPYRSAFANAGAGIAVAAPLAAVDPRALVIVTGARALAFALSPGPPRRIAESASDYGAAYDFERLVRLERLVGGVRRTLASRHPTLPRHARVAHHHLPHATRFAFARGKALQVWYRDTSLRWVDFEELRAGVDPRVVAIVEYQPHADPQLALVEPAALQALFDAGKQLEQQQWAAALAPLARADSLQSDEAAVVFRGLVAAKQSLAHAYLRHTEAAESTARRALSLWRDATDARLVLAGLWASQGRLSEAMAQIDSLLAVDPTDVRAIDLGGQIRAAMGAR